MTIYCDNMDHFNDVIYGLVIRGLMFEAHTCDLQIKLTGGF